MGLYRFDCVMVAIGTRKNQNTDRLCHREPVVHVVVREDLSYKTPTALEGLTTHSHPYSQRDVHWMRRALALARRGAGSVSPNPLVGALIVDEATQQLLGQGWHEAYGGDHAEVVALADAVQRGNAARCTGATLYVTLEPCCHHGKTPPCTEAIIRAGIGRVVAATQDPDGRVQGGGFKALEQAGIPVSVGPLAMWARTLNRTFIHHVKTQRPWVMLKVAQSLDGRIATSTGDSQWISGHANLRWVHRVRAAFDAVLVGAGTARVDDPQLTVRHVQGRHPRRIVLDGKNSLPRHLALFQSGTGGSTLHVTASDPNAPGAAHDAQSDHLTVWQIPGRDGYVDLPTLLARLGTTRWGVPFRPVQSLLVEAGPGLASALLDQNLVDELMVCVAPKLIGNGTTWYANAARNVLSDHLPLPRPSIIPMGDDLVMRYLLTPIPTE